MNRGQGVDAIMAQASDFAVYRLVGQRLRSLRTSHGLTQAQVAKLIDVSPQQYQKYEDAQTKCSLAAVLALAGYYGVTVESIVNPEGTRPSDLALSLENRLGDDIDLSRLSNLDLEMLNRLVDAFVHIPNRMEKVRIVELMEAMKSAHVE
jgi:transcriptional regulator with XRE-family HTH domain